MARYNEDLSWLRRVPAQVRVTVYDKGGVGQAVLPPEPSSRRRSRPRRQPWAQVIALPNVGREAHTYLHHIHSRLGNAGDPLPGTTVFCQGRPFDHAFDFRLALESLAQGGLAVGCGWEWLGHTIDTDTPDGALFRSWSKNPSGGGLDIAGFHRALLGREGPPEYRFVLGGQFAARREVIVARGAAFWERALEASASWPEAAHCFERAWAQVLGEPGPSDEEMAGRRTVHRKPVRRAEDAAEDAQAAG